MGFHGADIGIHDNSMVLQYPGIAIDVHERLWAIDRHVTSVPSTFMALPLSIMDCHGLSSCSAVETHDTAMTLHDTRESAKELPWLCRGTIAALPWTAIAPP